MSFNVLTLNEKKEWATSLEKLPLDQQDIFDTPDYYDLYERNGDGKAMCFVFEQAGDFAMYPFLLNSVNTLVGSLLYNLTPSLFNNGNT